MPKAGLKDSVWAPAGMLAAAAGLCLALGACQSSPKPSVGHSGAARTTSGGLRIDEAAPFSGLNALADRQSQAPDIAAMAMAPPPGVDPTDIAPLEAGPEAPGRAPLEVVLARFESEPDPAPEVH